jgi:hypothetical protein
MKQQNTSRAFHMMSLSALLLPPLVLVEIHWGGVEGRTEGVSSEIFFCRFILGKKQQNPPKSKLI